MDTIKSFGFAELPEVGWSKFSHHIGAEPKLADLSEEQVLPALGLAIAGLGYAIERESDTITQNQLLRHAVVPAASPQAVLQAATALVEAKLWTQNEEGDFIVGGATQAIRDKKERIEKASRAGRASQRARRLSEQTAEPNKDLDSDEIPF